MKVATVADLKRVIAELNDTDEVLLDFNVDRDLEALTVEVVDPDPAVPGPRYLLVKVVV